MAVAQTENPAIARVLDRHEKVTFPDTTRSHGADPAPIGSPADSPMRALENDLTGEPDINQISDPGSSVGRSVEIPFSVVDVCSTQWSEAMKRTLPPADRAWADAARMTHTAVQ